MLFQDALKLLVEGENLVRACWKPEDGYLTLLEGMKHVWKIITVPGPNAGNHIFSVEELSADDWHRLGKVPKAEVADQEAKVEL